MTPKGKAEELKLIKDKAHLWMNMINRAKAKSKRDLWIQAYAINGILRMQSPYVKDFDEVKEYLVKMGIVEPAPMDPDEIQKGNDGNLLMF